MAEMRPQCSSSACSCPSSYATTRCCHCLLRCLPRHCQQAAGVRLAAEVVAVVEAAEAKGPLARQQPHILCHATHPAPSHRLTAASRPGAAPRGEGRNGRSPCLLREQAAVSHRMCTYTPGRYGTMHRPSGCQSSRRSAPPWLHDPGIGTIVPRSKRFTWLARDAVLKTSTRRLSSSQGRVMMVLPPFGSLKHVHASTMRSCFVRS